jgi:tripartite-type tricarboxylate transporter receptor subunit TctC
MRLFRVVVGALAVSFFTVGAAMAQTWPAKAVRVVIPWPPGGSNDAVGRIVMQKVSESLGQQFLVDNRPGASGAIGAESVAKAPPDGYTIMVHSTTHLGNQHLYQKLTYDVIRDFTPVGTLAAQPGVLTTHPSLPVQSVKQFIALAKARPGQINYSSSGNGSAPHLSMALLASMTGIYLVHIPYKGGAPQVTALVGGEAHASLATISTVIVHVNSGRLRALGVSSTKRSAMLPGVPTIDESGVPGYEMSPWIAVYAPANTPRAIIDKLNTEVNKALKHPDVASSLRNQALDPLPSTPEAFAQRIRTDFEKYGKLIRATGVKVD